MGAKARRKVFSRLAASKPPLSTSLSHHISTKKFVTPPVLVAGHHHHSSVFEPSFELNLPVQNLQHLPRHQKGIFKAFPSKISTSTQVSNNPTSHWTPTTS